MNAPHKKPQAAETVEDVLDKLAKHRETNLRIWSALGKTDPAHTKGFKRAGGFQGTAIKPIWITQRLTEQFGPCGEGWGTERPEFQLVTAGDDILVYCIVTAWYLDSGKQHFLYGIGGDRVQGKNKYGIVTDDEAFKKAFTDALGNAFKFVGVGADVHMGLFEDSKYLAEVTAEFHPKPEPEAKGRQERIAEHKDDPFPQGPAKNKTHLKDMGRAFWRDVEACGDSDELECLLADKSNVQLVNQIMKALPNWWDGGVNGSGETFEGLEAVIARKRRDFEQLENAR
jgi:hypothetical protein